jgi:thiol-disulfide isomerase/thioredoxin
MRKLKYTLEFCQELANKNNGLCLSKVSGKTHDLMEWKCAVPEHLPWKTSLSNIIRGRWCAKCSGVAKHTLDYCMEFAKTKNGQCLDKIYIDVFTKMSWQCNTCNHIWKARFTDIKNNGTWCPNCYKYGQRTSLKNYQDFAKKLGGECLSNSTNSVHDKLLWQCIKGHQWAARFCDIKNKNSWCPTCFSFQPKAQQAVHDFIENLGFLTIFNDKQIIYPKELDIYIPEKKIAIEYCGLYWHGEANNKNQSYHLNKLKLCQEQGIRLITIFEDEWLNKQEQVMGYLRAILGKATIKIDARKCVIRIIENKVAKQFHNNNHIQGYANGTHIGLYFNDELVCISTFTNNLSSRKTNNNFSSELIRYTIKINYSVRGGCSKLINNFIKTNPTLTQIISFSDNRWSNGKLYQTLNFTKENNNGPSYWYFTKKQRYHKCNFQKARLKKLFPECDIINNTEWEIMKNNGYDRIWDCGNIKWILKIK